MKTHDYIFAIIIFTLMGWIIAEATLEIKNEIKQSKQHHENYHKLVKENYRLNDWYQNHDCDVSYEPCQVVVECEIE